MPQPQDRDVSGATTECDNAVHLNNDMTFSANVSGVDCSCLLDTGSTISLINKAVFDVLPNQPQLTKTATVAKTASKDVLPLLGRSVLSFRVGGVFASVPMYVSDKIDVPCLLGLDFLQACPCVIDVTRRQLVLAPAESVRSVSAEAVSVGTVVLSETVSVPPGREMILTGRVPNGDYRGPALLEPTLSVEGLEFVGALVELTGASVPCIVRNVTTEPVSVPKRAELGLLQVGFAELPSPSSGTTQKKLDIPAFVNDRCPSLSTIQREQVASLLQQYESMFDGHIGHTDIVTHSIDTGDSDPVRQQPRRVPPQLKEELKAQIDELVHQGILVESFGSWSSPVCLVKKKNGSIRMCADLRRLNSVTRTPSYPIPRMDDTLDALAGSSLFCTLDLNSCYYQISVDPEDQHKTQIVTPFGSHSFTRMPFGAAGAPMTCARLLNVVLGNVPASECVHYFDDIIVHGSTFAEVFERLERVLARLNDAGLTVNLEKCDLFQKSVVFLGHVVSEQGLGVNPAQLSKVRDWPVPRTQKELISFLGLASFFRKYVRDFSRVAGPLLRLTGKDVRFVWNDEAQHSFDSLKQALCNAPVIALPRFGPEAGEFTLRCDASGEGIGAVLSQTQDGVEKVISYASHRLSKSQRNYSATKLELLACVTFVQHFRHFLLGRRFRLVTDHASLQWLINFRNPSGMLARWLERLSEYDFQLIHRPGSENTVADALSRRPADRTDVETQTESPVMAQCKRVSAESGVQTESLPTEPPTTTARGSAESWSTGFIRGEQGKDPVMADIIRSLSTGRRSNRRDLSPAARVLLRQWDRLTLVDGVLYRRCRQRPGQEALQLVIPDGLVAGVLTSLHAGPTGGHFGAEKLTEQVRLRFWWPRLAPAVREFCQRCDRCTSRASPNPKSRARMGELRSEEPFDTIAIDFLSGLPATERGNKHLLVVTDHFTRWVECFPVPDMKASTVADVLVNEFIARFGCPRRIHSDCAANFQSDIITEMSRLLGIERSKISPYHPEGNSKCERMMRTVIDMLSKYLNENHDEWDLHIPLLMMGYRSQVHSSLGYSPYFLMFAREPRLPADVSFAAPQARRNRTVAQYVDRLCESLKVAHKFALQTSDTRHRRNKALYDQKSNEFTYAPGDSVLLYRSVVPKGQYYKFVRPWKRAIVKAKLGEFNYRVRLEGTRKNLVVHHNRLKPAPPVTPSSRTPGTAAGDDVQLQPQNRAAVGKDGGGGLAEALGRFAIRPAHGDGMVLRSTESVVIDIEGPGAVLPLYADGQPEPSPIPVRPQAGADQPGPDATRSATTTPDREATRTATTPEDGSSGQAASPASLMELGASPVRLTDSPADPVALPLELGATPVELTVEDETLPRRSARERVPPDRFVPRW